MEVYQTDENGVFVGITVADESPLQPGVWLIPHGCVEKEPPAFQNKIARWNKTKKDWDLEDIPEPVKEPPPEEIEKTRLFKTTIWIRATDEEAVVLKNALDNAPVKLRMIYEAAAYLDHKDPNFNPLKQTINQLFGEERANELLEPEF